MTTINMQPHEYLKLQIRLPNEGIFMLDDPTAGRLDVEQLGGDADEQFLFVLDQSMLDSSYMSAPGDDPNSTWSDVTGFIKNISLTRGAKETETGSELEAGILNVSLAGPELDPHQNTSVKSGAMVRLLTVDDEPVFTGVIRRVTTDYTPHGDIRVNLTIQDTVQVLANLSHSVLYEEDFDVRIDSLLGSEAINYKVSSPPVVDGSEMFTSVLGAATYEASLLEHLQLAVDTERGFFYVDREGAVIVGDHYALPDPYNRTLLRTNLKKNAGLRDSDWGHKSIGPVQHQYLTNQGRGQRGTMKQTFTASTSAAGTGWQTDSASTYGEQLITAGKTYTFSNYFRTNRASQKVVCIATVYSSTGSVLGTYTGSTVTLAASDWMRASVTFTAPASAAKVYFQFGPPATGALTWNAKDWLMASDLMLEEGAVATKWFDGRLEPGPNQNVIYQYPMGSSDLDGNAQEIQLALKPETLRFYGSTTNKPKTYYYKEIQYEYDSSAIVNQLAIENVLGSEISTYKSEDRNSIAAYGNYSATMRINSSLIPYFVLDDLVAEVFKENAYPVNTVRSLVLNMTDYMDVAAQLDPYQVVEVQFENDYFEEIDTYVILGVEHEIQRDKWMTTLTLTKYNI